MSTKNYATFLNLRRASTSLNSSVIAVIPTESRYVTVIRLIMSCSPFIAVGLLIAVFLVNQGSAADNIYMPACNDTLNGVHIFNGCFIDQTKYLIPSAVASQLLKWFTVRSHGMEMI